MVTCITSDSRIPINTCFRVSAGPGAGKTHWLANHIQHILNSSDRLNRMSKIACISYTNVGQRLLSVVLLCLGNGLLFQQFIVFCIIIY